MHKFGNFLVGFRYPEPDVTICTIKDAETFDTLGESHIKRYFRDPCVKRLARKVALHKAILDANLDRDSRKSIYDGYNAIGALKGNKTGKE